jgi:hypothetical protein
VDWREFELGQKYGFHWQKMTKTRKERIRKKIKEEVKGMVALVPEIEGKNRSQNGRSVSQNAHSQQDSKTMPDGSTSCGDEGSSMRPKIDLSNPDTETLNIAKFNSNTGEQDELAHQKPVQGRRLASRKTMTEHRSGQRASDVFDDNSDETGW